MSGRYNPYTLLYRDRYGVRLQKLVIDAGFTCPNRDGTVGRGGCTFCDNAAFHPGYSTPGKSIIQQLDEGILFHRTRYRHAGGYLAYFQSYSNTYAPLEELAEKYSEALSHPEVAGIAVGTRPDCIDEEKIAWFKALREGRILKDWRREVGCRSIDAPEVFLEYGIESTYDSTLERINRGHGFEAARRAVEMTAEAGLDCGAHFILGLPGETKQMMLDQCRTINSLPLTSVKFHQLQFILGTPMEREHREHPEEFVSMELPEYIDFIIDILERLRPDLHIERVAGEVPPRFVGTPQWGLVRNVEILRMLENRLEERDTYQGRLLSL